MYLRVWKQKTHLIYKTIILILQSLENLIQVVYEKTCPRPLGIRQRKAIEWNKEHVSQKHLWALSNVFFKLSIIGTKFLVSTERKGLRHSNLVMFLWIALKDWKKNLKMLMQHCGTSGVISGGIFNLVLSSIKKMCEITVPELCNNSKKLGTVISHISLRTKAN